MKRLTDNLGKKSIIRPTVSAGYFRALLEFAAVHGADKNKLLEISKINPDLLNDKDNRLPLASYILLTQAAKELTDDPTLPLKLGAHTNSNETSVYGLLCYSAQTMAEGLTFVNRFGYLVAELDIPEKDNRFKIIPENGKVWMEDTRYNPNSFPELTEETWARFIAETTRNFPDEPFVKEVHVTHSEPAHSADYAEYMKAPVVFGSDRNALLIHESWLSINILTPNVYILGALSDHAQKFLNDLQQSKTTRAQVESLLIPILHKGEFRMKYMAVQMGCSRQTLYRKLKAEDITFERLLDELRFKMATHYLDGKKATVNETAYLVGFSDPSSFSSAFKRWTGEAPGSYCPD